MVHRPPTPPKSGSSSTTAIKKKFLNATVVHSYYYFADDNYGTWDEHHQQLSYQVLPDFDYDLDEQKKKKSWHRHHPCFRHGFKWAIISIVLVLLLTSLGYHRRQKARMNKSNTHQLRANGSTAQSQPQAVAVVEILSDTLGAAMEGAGEWMQPHTETVLGETVARSVASAVSSGLERAGEWLDSWMIPGAFFQEEQDDDPTTVEQQQQDINEVLALADLSHNEPSQLEVMAADDDSILAEKLQQTAFKQKKTVFKQ